MVPNNIVSSSSPGGGTGAKLLFTFPGFASALYLFYTRCRLLLFSDNFNLRNFLSVHIIAAIHYHAYVV